MDHIGAEVIWLWTYNVRIKNERNIHYKADTENRFIVLKKCETNLKLSVRYVVQRRILPSVAAAVHRPAADHLKKMEKQHVGIIRRYFLNRIFSKISLKISDTDPLRILTSLDKCVFPVSRGTETTNFTVCDIVQYRISDNFRRQQSKKLKHLVAVLEDYFRS